MQGTEVHGDHVFVIGGGGAVRRGDPGECDCGNQLRRSLHRHRFVTGDQLHAPRRHVHGQAVGLVVN